MLRAERLEFLLPGRQGLLLAGVEANVAVTVAEVGVYVVLLDPTLDDLGTLIADLEDRAQAIFADILANLLQVMADTRHDLPAVATGAAEAEVAPFQHDDVGNALLRQFQRGIDTGEAPPYHHNVGLDIRLEHGEAEVVFL